ncbi:MAG: hypothetical protein ACTTJC_01015 [Campylobacter sp.]
MSKICAVFLLIFFSFANATVSFEEEHIFELKKDEWARVFITKKGTDERDSFDFRWTLFDNTNVVIHSFYRKYPRQFIMSLRHGLTTYKQTLLPDYKYPPRDHSTLFLVFEDYKKGVAKFRVLIKDEEKRVDVEFLDPPKRR